ncbi:MAG: restriction endonuclease subunit S, partial [Clostridia bacterium]|nr:restriction endonuclease subunit S [Clostridia bacterium]
IYPFIDENKITTNYLFKVLPLISQSGDTKTAIKGNTLNSDSLDSLLIPLPPVNEQKRICDKIDELNSPLCFYEESENEARKLDMQFPEQLKKSILQMAVQGKLVPQDENDEPASVLLERIRAEKQRLIAEGKIKKDKNESVIFRRDNSHYEKFGNTVRCIDDEIPFDIPDLWDWVRLGTVFQHNTGKALNGANRDGQKLTYITTSNLYWDCFVLDKLKEMYFTESEVDKCTVQYGDLLVCEGGDIGRAAIWNIDKPMRIQNHIHRLRSYAPICTRFFYYLFYLYKKAGWIGGKGIGIQGLSSNALHSLLFPLPPLKEQFRIVEAIESSIKIVDKL